MMKINFKALRSIFKLYQDKIHDGIKVSSIFYKLLILNKALSFKKNIYDKNTTNL